jgi:chromosome segregation ATPase
MSKDCPILILETESDTSASEENKANPVPRISKDTSNSMIGKPSKRRKPTSHRARISKLREAHRNEISSIARKMAYFTSMVKDLSLKVNDLKWSRQLQHWRKLETYEKRLNSMVLHLSDTLEALSDIDNFYSTNQEPVQSQLSSTADQPVQAKPDESTNKNPTYGYTVLPDGSMVTWDKKPPCSTTSVDMNSN